MSRPLPPPPPPAPLALAFARSGFVLRPYNYFNEDEAMDTREIAMWRQKEEGKPWKRVRSLEGKAKGCVPKVTPIGFSGQQDEA